MGGGFSGNATGGSIQQGDVLSKYAWVQPLKNKTGKEVVKAFQNILKTSKRRSQSLQTDKGKEFYNATLQQWLKTEGIQSKCQ